MSSSDVRYPPSHTPATPPVVTPHYGSSLPSPADDGQMKGKFSVQPKSCLTLHGILTIVTIVAFVCVIISAGVVTRAQSRDLDYQASAYGLKTAKVSAFNTRNAVLTFAVIGLILALADAILYLTNLISMIPPMAQRIFSIVMLVLALVLLILGCCAAAWQKKMTDVAKVAPVAHKGAAGSASFFLFLAMIAIIVNYVLLLISPHNTDPPMS